MRRTNIYLSEDQLDLLQQVATLQGRPVSELVREAIDDWLQAQGARRVTRDEWERRFDELLNRRDRIWRENKWDAEQVERDVMDAVREVRRARAARRR
jgi:Ribbon-helix-helix protein, copG family